MDAPRTVRLAAAALLLVLLGACSSDDGTASVSGDGRGDACEQAISNITYAENVLKPLGQEEYQDFDDNTRSRMVDVAGTLRMEDDPWPSEEIADQTARVADLAEQASEPDADDPGRTLLEYRVEAARLVLLCRESQD